MLTLPIPVVLALMILAPGCARKYSGPAIRSFDDAAVIVSDYQFQVLTESEFLQDWPDLHHRYGDKEGGLWGILETTDSSTGKRESRAYLVGYMESTVLTRATPATPIYTVTDSAGVVSSHQEFETVSSQNWSRHLVWRFDFEDSMLVGMEMVAAP